MTDERVRLQKEGRHQGLPRRVPGSCGEATSCPIPAEPRMGHGPPGPGKARQAGVRLDLGADDAPPPPLNLHPRDMVYGKEKKEKVL